MHKHVYFFSYFFSESDFGWISLMEFLNVQINTIVIYFFLFVVTEVKPLNCNCNIFCQLLEELMDGDIIIYQRADLLNDASLELPTAKDYLKEIFLKVEVRLMTLSDHKKD